MSNLVFRRLISWECRTCGRVISGDEEPKSCNGNRGCGATGEVVWGPRGETSGGLYKTTMTPDQYGASIPVDDKLFDLTPQEIRPWETR